jgi:hypothetical protein
MEKGMDDKVNTAIKQAEISAKDIIRHLEGVIDHECCYPRLVELLRHDLKQTIDYMMLFSPRIITSRSLKNLDLDLAKLYNILEKMEKKESEKIKKARQEIDKRHKESEKIIIKFDKIIKKEKP